MEIERKFLIRTMPENLEQYPCLEMEQGYLSINPVIRVRRQNEEYVLTYKSAGMMSRQEFNLPLTKESYEHLREKTDGRLIQKKRYLIPFQDKYTIELDLFEGFYHGLILAEVEFSTEVEAMEFLPPDWFGEDVTFKEEYHNSVMSQK